MPPWQSMALHASDGQSMVGVHAGALTLPPSLPPSRPAAPRGHVVAPSRGGVGGVGAVGPWARRALVWQGVNATVCSVWRGGFPPTPRSPAEPAEPCSPRER